MTVRAQQRAFSRLLAAALEASSHAGLGQPEGLRRWVAMVELQGGGRPDVSASVACTAGLGDEDRFDPPTPTHDGTAPRRSRVVERRRSATWPRPARTG